MKLSIVIPAHNEEARLGAMLTPYLAFFAPRYGNDVELIVVVNGSTDRTAAVADGFARQYPQLKVLEDSARIGKGGAIMLGARAARGDLIGFVDADGATPPEAFQDLVDRIGDAGTIIASRWLPGARVSPAQPRARRVPVLADDATLVPDVTIRLGYEREDFALEAREELVTGTLHLDV